MSIKSTLSQKDGVSTFDPKGADVSYLEHIKQYEKSPFYQQLVDNPYLHSKNSPFEPSFFQQLGESFFGDYSARAEYYGNLDNQRNQYLTEILGQMRQQDYDSAPAQLERMKLAGQNPDLNGGSSISPGSSAENDQPAGAYHYPQQASAAEIVGGFADLTMKAYSFASGFAKDMLSFQSMEQAITKEESENASRISSLVREFIRDTARRPYFDKDSNRWVFSSDVSFQNLEDFANNFFRSRSDRRKFVHQYGRAFDSAQSMLSRFTDIADAEKAVKAVNDALGTNLSMGYDYDFRSPTIQDPVVMISKELGSMSLALRKAELSHAYTTHNFHKKVLNNSDPVLQGEATNATNQNIVDTNEALKSKRKVDKIVNDTLHTIISKLAESANEGGIGGALSKGLLLYYSTFGLTLPSLPSINLDFNKKVSQL